MCLKIIPSKEVLSIQSFITRLSALAVYVLIICTAFFVAPSDAALGEPLACSGLYTLKSDNDSSKAQIRASAEALVGRILEERSWQSFDSKLLRERVGYSLEKIQDPRMRENLQIVLNGMNTKKFWKDYLIELVADSALSMSSANTLVQSMSRRWGWFDRSNLHQVLIQRAEKRGQQVSTVWTMNVRQLRKAIAKGPFVDWKMKGSFHGADTHLVQLDFAAYLLNQSGKSNEDIHQMHQFLATEKGFAYWEAIFDAEFVETPNSPEELMRMLSQILPVQ